MSGSIYQLGLDGKLTLIRPKLKGKPTQISLLEWGKLEERKKKELQDG